MTNPFASEAMAAGYATARPPVHAQILELARPHLPKVVPLALDIGCGSGLSTKPLLPVTKQCIGLEPSEAMLRYAKAVAPAAAYVAASAEAIPFHSRTFSLITAAGSLNYVNLDRFFPEAARLLTPGGVLLVYDFSPGQSEGDSQWLTEFQCRYPPPPNEAQALDPELLLKAAPGFRLKAHRSFHVLLTLTLSAYLNYILTETNVSHAVRHGTPIEEIRCWCQQTLDPIWQGREQQVVFPGYFACLTVP